MQTISAPPCARCRRTMSDAAAVPTARYGSFVLPEFGFVAPHRRDEEPHRPSGAGAVADLLTSGDPAGVALIDITKNNMRAAFAAYASTHEPASIRRCWSTWNVLCDFLYAAELIPANPMPFVGRPKAAKTLPRSLPQPAVTALLDVVDRDHESTRRTDWPQRDLALILTGLLAGLRADELAEPTSVIFGPAPMAVRSFMSGEKAASTAPCRSRSSCYR